VSTFGTAKIVRIYGVIVNLVVFYLYRYRIRRCSMHVRLPLIRKASNFVVEHKLAVNDPRRKHFKSMFMSLI